MNGVDNSIALNMILLLNSKNDNILLLMKAFALLLIGTSPTASNVKHHNKTEKQFGPRLGPTKYQA